ncbi:hypothetical protein [Brevibacillus dissolubilis]|uniref:hypothetical protein n=1 Tax=Brevibacillus dissolubilis TaxID=1844116 RepID=UPI00159BE4B3|nr:hypothetical protein [Brevibacillus dissolubilis]
MDFYHSFIYTYIFNSTWFIYTVIAVVCLINILSPILLWIIFSGKGGNKKKA